jgi:uncharacterized membrane protein YqjE
MIADPDLRLREDVPGEGRGITGLVRDIARDLIQLVRGEVALARSELGDKAGQVGRGGAKILAGGLLGVIALLILSEALVIALAHAMPAWLASIIVAIVLAVIGVLLALQGRRHLKPDLLIPRRTSRNLERDAQLVKERF